MSRRVRFFCLLAVPTVSLALYVGTYMTLVRREFWERTGHGYIVADPIARYAFAEDVCRRVFLPAHRLDVKVRSSYWSSQRAK